jgi:iron complex transport system ATP-binding protein
MSIAVQTDNLAFAYKDKVVLNGVSLLVEKGEMLGILGPNGSGKTTLLKVLSGVLAGTGKIKINDKTLGSYSRRELSRLFAVVPQENHVSFPYTLAEIVLMGRASHHNSLAFEGERDREVARVIIARALAQEPEILLLDEPSAFLDLKHQVHILEILRQLNRDQKLTIVAALHDLNLAALFFPRLIMLRDGKIYRDGTPKEVLTEKAIEEVYGIRVRVEQDLSWERPQLFIRPSLRD